MGKILILGGYGNFGKRIATALARTNDIIIAGRSEAKAEALSQRLGAQAASFDARDNFAQTLVRLEPSVVINTCGPFQRSDYEIAKYCIAAGIHYIDLADGRDFVNGITSLDASAQAANCHIISGASTVPGLSSAVIEHYWYEFHSIDSLRYGVAPGQKSERGLATVQSILSYLGKAFKPIPGDSKPRYGWQDIHLQTYPTLGKRWMANCDIPDLDLLPPRYAITKICFSAGMENSMLHLLLFVISWLIRLGIPLRLEKYARMLLRASNLFDWFGTDTGGMHVLLSGTGTDGQPHARNWFIIARRGDGPQIPCVPAIILARKLAAGELSGGGAQACVGLVTLEEYLEELKSFAVTTYEA